MYGEWRIDKITHAPRKRLAWLAVALFLAVTAGLAYWCTVSSNIAHDRGSPSPPMNKQESRAVFTSHLQKMRSAYEADTSREQYLAAVAELREHAHEVNDERLELALLYICAIYYRHFSAFGEQITILKEIIARWPDSPESTYARCALAAQEFRKIPYDTVEYCKATQVELEFGRIMRQMAPELLKAARAIDSEPEIARQYKLLQGYGQDDTMEQNMLFSLMRNAQRLGEEAEADQWYQELTTKYPRATSGAQNMLQRLRSVK